jgi:predicted dienelactone hydrolase
MGSEVSVFYPVDMDEYMKAIRAGKNTMWLRHGDHTLLGLAKASIPYGREDHPSLFWFRYFRRIRMDTATDAEISKDFMTDKTSMDVEHINKNQLVPVIFSHGLSANRTLHSGTCRDLASFGYIVFAPDHMDLTCSYFEGQDGKGTYYCNKRDSHDLQFRQSQLDQRVKEVRALIDEISQPSFLQKMGFPEDVSLNLDQLIVSGHSFGGMTAIDTSV